MKKFLLLALGIIALRATAHEPFQSFVSVRLHGGRLEMTLTMSIIAAERLLDPRPPELLSPESFAAHAAELKAGAPALFRLAAESGVLSLQSAKAYLTEEEDVEFFLVYPRPPAGRLKITLSYLAKMSDDHHGTLAVVDEAGGNLAWEELTPDEPSLTTTVPGGPGSTPAVANVATSPVPAVAAPTTAVSRVATSPAVSPPAPRRSFFGRFFLLGVEHILTGYDHLLFLCGLLVVCRRLRPMVTIITCFTIAHSITLALAALGVVAIPPKIVEPLIAASIVYVGAENLWRHGEPKARWLLTGCFGLIHGFGFAGALIESGLGANGTPMLVPLFSFNLGVEAGQLAVAAVFVPILWQLRKWKPFERYGVRVVSGFVVLAGSYWLVQRVFFT